MKRYTFLLLIALGGTATGLAGAEPAQHAMIEANARNVTVIEKNQAFPLVGPFDVVECLDPECTITLE